MCTIPHRKLLLIFALLFLSTWSWAQTPQHEELRARFMAFAKFTQALEVDSIIAYTYPKLFELAPAEMVAAQFEQIAADTNMRIEFGTVQLDSLSPAIFSYEGQDYAMVYYHAPMYMTMLSEEYREEEFYEMLGQMLAAQYGIEHLSGDAEERRFAIDAPKQLFAIRRKKEEPWYFIEYKSDNPMILNMLIDAEVRKHFDLE